MKKLKSNKFFKSLVFIFLILYLSGSFTNMLFIPRYVPAYLKTAAVSGFTFNRMAKYANFHTPNFLQIIDKSIFDNDQVNPLCFIPKSFLIIFSGFGLAAIKFRSTEGRYGICFNSRRAYLSFCTFRIWCKTLDRNRVKYTCVTANRYVNPNFVKIP